MTDKNLPVIIDQSRRTWRERLDAGGIDLNKPVTLRDYIGQTVQLETGALVMFQDPATIQIAADEKLSLAKNQHYRYRLQYFDDYAAEEITLLVTFPALFHDEEVDIKALHGFLTRQRLLSYDVFTQQPPQQSEVGLFYRILKRVDDYVMAEKMRWDVGKEHIKNPHRVRVTSLMMSGLEIEGLDLGDDEDDLIYTPNASNSWVNKHTRWVPAIQINRVVNYSHIQNPRVRMQHTGWGSQFRLHLPVHLTAQLTGPLEEGHHALSGPAGELSVVTLTSRHDWDEVVEKLLIPEGCKVVDLMQPQADHFMDVYPPTDPKRSKSITDLREGVMGWYSALIPALMKEDLPETIPIRFLALSAIPLLDEGKFETRATPECQSIRLAPDAWVGWNALVHRSHRLCQQHVVMVSTDPQHFQSLLLKACEGWTIFAKVLRNLIIEYDALLAPLSNADATTGEIIQRGVAVNALLGEIKEIAEKTRSTSVHADLMSLIDRLEGAVRSAVLSDKFFDFTGGAAGVNLPGFVAAVDCNGVNKQVPFADALARSMRERTYMGSDVRMEYLIDAKWERAQAQSEGPVRPAGPAWWDWLMEKLFKGKK